MRSTTPWGKLSPSRVPLVAVLAALMLPSVAAAAAEIEPAVPADPRVTAILDKLGANQSAILPEMKVVGDPGPLAREYRMAERGPGGRDFTIKMAWMPDRRRAFFCGANHGSPHRLNDAWEFDLPSNSWIVLYAADYNDRGGVGDYDKEVLTLDDGWLRTKRGGPAHPAHTWWGLTYDPQRKQVMWWCQWPGYRLDPKLEVVGGGRDDLYKGPPLWTFDPFEKKWEPLPTKQPWAPMGLAGSLEYVPELNGVLWTHRNAGAWLLESDSESWKELTKGNVRTPIETVVCYDSARKRMLAHRGAHQNVQDAQTWHMPVEGAGVGEWTKVVEGPDLPNGHDARSFFHFDPVGKVGLLYEVRDRRIWSYDPDQTKWTRLEPDGPPPPESGNARTVGYHDPARNVSVVNMGTSTWVYRHRAAEGE
ncbi:MAG: hypothetical protein WD066_20090 [Planctomycetaceae bacterium]